ncbi:hypothetical protein DPV78_007451 [Talaromyces pinophilus]|nr:hypothetical protein DPV78_007451 [Talaromyces pinophilus]
MLAQIHRISSSSDVNLGSDTAKREKAARSHTKKMPREREFVLSGFTTWQIASTRTLLAEDLITDFVGHALMPWSKSLEVPAQQA